MFREERERAMFRDERERTHAQLNLRVAVLGGMALIMFSIVFFRLWYLQVLSSAKYVKDAQNNQVRSFTVQAPRGEILDRTGQVLVKNRTALSLQVRTIDLPQRPHKRRRELVRLGKLVGLPYSKIRHDIHVQHKQVPASPVTLRRDVPYDLVYYLRENQDRYPGVSVDRVYVRSYTRGTLAAHVLGYVREIDAAELREPRFAGVKPGDQVGQAGVEDSYDSVLRGINGMERVQVDAAGQPTGHVLARRAPKGGDNLKLSLSMPVQEAGESAVSSFGLPGAFVAMNVHNGQILGLGSNPTYDPSVFAKPVLTKAETAAIFGSGSSSNPAPIYDRAIQGLYPTGSTMKPITSVAGLSSGKLTASTVINDTGCFDIGGGHCLRNAGGGAAGALTLVPALQVSDDYFFYQVGEWLNTSDTRNGPLQKWAKALGLGHTTGIDLPGETSGLVPGPPWRNRLYKQHKTDRPWSYGDNVQLATGQGDLEADPLQMATAYSAIGNGGDVVRPHVGLEVTKPNGQVVQEIDPAPQRHVDIAPAYRNDILGGIHEAAQSPGGTSYQVFGGYPVPVAGKTGTAVRYPYGYPGPEVDQSWYVVLAPYPNPKVVVAVTIERGGFGVQAAAPAAQRILTAYFNSHGRHVKAGPISVPGSVSSVGAY
jgi:penicillin-binding protein 2